MSPVRIVALTAVLIATFLCSATTAGEPSLADLCKKMSGFDQNEDGRPEIESLRPLVGAGESGKLALLLVEARLLEPVAGAPALTPHLEQWVVDLAEEGYRAEAVAVALEPSSLHKDGRYVLALREFLRAVQQKHGLAGVLLVGRFPDAFLVRTCNWRKKGDFTLAKGRATERSFSDTPYLRRVPESVAHRADIVLSDLDGRWEDVYVQPRTTLPTTWAVFPDGIPEKGGPCVDVDLGSVTWRDFFHVADGELEVKGIAATGEQDAELSLVLHDERRDFECGFVDAIRPNAMARPDILVSRLDARGTAFLPRRDIVGVDNRHLLDEHGKPQAVRFESKAAVPHWRQDLLEHDPQLERRLLAEYFMRNHSYRTGESAVAFRPSSISNGLGSGYDVMKRASDDWEEADPTLADFRGNTTLSQFISWLAYPAILRTIRAHSDAWGSQFSREKTSELERHIGGPPWSWTPEGERLVPSLVAACGGGKMDWFLLRTLYENGVVAQEPAFYHHMGCHGISSPEATHRPHDHPSYGRRQGAEALLFFGNGLSLVGRSKVFYDEPRSFAETLKEGRTFGEAWAQYYEIESAASSWKRVGGDIGRKRAYFWSVLGDWSLRLSSGARPR